MKFTVQINRGSEKRPFNVGHLLATAGFFAYNTAPGFGPRTILCILQLRMISLLHMHEQPSNVKNQISSQTIQITSFTPNFSSKENLTIQAF